MNIGRLVLIGQPLFEKRSIYYIICPKKRKGVQGSDVLLRVKEIIRIFAVVKFTAVKE